MPRLSAFAQTLMRMPPGVSMGEAVKCPGFDGDIEQPEGQSVHGSTAEVPGGVA